MTVERTGRMVNITPKPRILKVLSRIEFDPWQCISELVDNSFDEFIDIQRTEPHWNEPFEVAVSLPSQTSIGQADASVVVSDNGRGMTLDRVTEAVSAGFSGNDPVSKLGLFGMGFNVATARIGSVTRFLTTREGEAEWVGVEIDLDAIREGYEVPEITLAKDSPSQHGTRVEIGSLEPFAQWFSRPGNQSKLRETLGSVYSYLLTDKGYRLLVNGISVKPYRHCVWGRERSVTRDGEVIPAIIDIDHDLGERAVCRECGLWQDPDNAECEECGYVDLEVRPRRIRGWLGVQRYLDPKEYGVDFLRNGRKILRFNKTVFQWRDPDDPSAQGDIEYPIEVPNNQGRIVGEIHLDHVQVTYTKDSFDTGDRSWRKAMELVRGAGPLLPRRAAELRYERNDSPLGRLHRGYRRNDPGSNYLTPGNGRVRFDNREWDKRFQAGDPEYQDDTRWWDGVVEHDRLVAEEKQRKIERDQAAAARTADPTREFSEERPALPDENAQTAAEQESREAGDTSSEHPRTEAELVEYLAGLGSPIPELNTEFTATGVPGRPVRLNAWRVRGEALKTPEGRRIPVWLVGGRGGSMSAFADADHPYFQSFADDPADLILIELAQHLLMRAQGSSTVISAVYAELKDRYLNTHAVDRNRLIAEATQVLRDIQERMVSCVSDNPTRPWLNALNDAERYLTGDRITENYKTADVDSVVERGEYLPLIPPAVVARVVEEWPEAFFDGRLFVAPYTDVKSASARRQTVAGVTGYLDDVAWLASVPSSPSKEQLLRASLSLRLIPEALAPE